MAGKYFSAIEKDTSIASGATLRSDIGIGNCTAVSLHLDWTISASATTSTSIWTSNMNNPGSSTDADWVEETAITITGPTGSSNGKSMTHLANINSRWLRVKVVSTSGTVNTFSIYAHGKD